jgi:hypothetical protein
VNRYDAKAGIIFACIDCFPDSTYVGYKGYSAKKLLKDILNKLEEMQRTKE